MKKVLVAISGGVDSSVCALLLKKQGFDVLGVYMRLNKNYKKDERAARQVCGVLGIKFYPLNFSEKFKKEVIDYFVSSYRVGATPNPCVKCNYLIKFNELLRVKNELGAVFLATGHYARIIKERNNFNLFRGKDKSKDQSYFLYNLKQEWLKEILFPLGDLTKEEIKTQAAKANLPNLKIESQDVCFLLEEGKIIEHNEYLKKYLKKNPGPIMTLDGKKVGEHQGLYFYTIGQRRGIEIGGTGPYYAAKTDYKNNILYVVADANDPALFGDNFSVGDANWLDAKIKFPLRAEVVIRYRHKSSECKIFNEKNKQYQVKLKQAERAITPGQSAVFYQGDKVLGGGIIIL
ncbi:tRNA 2-thiouridine(34) synthase MnmA [Candidatus Parcubacteria bacterium]|nr:tRNA 2-thiouridine(34) synthase MnmA [Candidatus Parcubacteria bacterium]